MNFRLMTQEQVDDAFARAWRLAGPSPSAVARALGVAHGTAYHHLRRLGYIAAPVERPERRRAPKEDQP